jgi:hypothetical protein
LVTSGGVQLVLQAVGNGFDPFSFCQDAIGIQEFIRFLNAIEGEIPARKIMHVILYNYGSHKHPKVRAWLDRHPRFVFHYTSKSASLTQCRRGLLRQAQ